LRYLKKKQTRKETNPPKKESGKEKEKHLLLNNYIIPFLKREQLFLYYGIIYLLLKLIEVKMISSPSDAASLAQQIELKQYAQDTREKRTMDSLSSHIAKIWEKVRDENKTVRQQMVEELDICKGKYPNDKLAAIKQFGGSTSYFRLLENKCRAASSWVADIYWSNGKPPYGINPTPIPELPEDSQAKIQQLLIGVQQQMMQDAQMRQQAGEQVDPQMYQAQLEEIKEQVQQKEITRIKEEAQEKADNMLRLIEDQNEQGGFKKAFHDFLYYLVRVKAGILKGPIVRKKKQQVWSKSPEGEYALEYKDVLVPEVYCVSPFNFYPSIGMTSPDDGDIIEIHELTKTAIADLLGVPGYNDIKIRAVLDEVNKGSLKDWINIDDADTVKRTEKSAEAAQAQVTPDKIKAMEFWGSVPGSFLIDWGIEGEIDPEMQYEIDAWKIGTHVIKAVINPDKLGRKPYSVTSWAKNPAWIWGDGLVDFGKDVEEAMLALVRAGINNVAIASGPQVERNTDRCNDRTPMFPWKIWDATSAQMKEAPAMNFYQPQMHIAEIQGGYNFFGRILDELTVPAFAHGDSMVGGAGNTASGLNMLIQNASRSIKAVIRNIDNDIIVPYIQRCYDFNMLYSDDLSIKGDAKITAEGVSYLTTKEQQATRKNELLMALSNPMFAQLMGQPKLQYVLDEVVKAHDIDFPSDVVKETKRQQAQAMIQPPQGADPAQQAAGNPASGGSPAAPQTIGQDGGNMGGNIGG